MRKLPLAVSLTPVHPDLEAFASAVPDAAGQRRRSFAPQKAVPSLT